MLLGRHRVIFSPLGILLGLLLRREDVVAGVAEFLGGGLLDLLLLGHEVVLGLLLGRHRLVLGLLLGRRRLVLGVLGVLLGLLALPFHGLFDLARLLLGLGLRPLGFVLHVLGGIVLGHLGDGDAEGAEVVVEGSVVDPEVDGAGGRGNERVRVAMVRGVAAHRIRAGRDPRDAVLGNEEIDEVVPLAREGLAVPAGITGQPGALRVSLPGPVLERSRSLERIRRIGLERPGRRTPARIGRIDDHDLERGRGKQLGTRRHLHDGGRRQRNEHRGDQRSRDEPDQLRTLGRLHRTSPCACADSHAANDVRHAIPLRKSSAGSVLAITYRSSPSDQFST